MIMGMSRQGREGDGWSDEGGRTSEGNVTRYRGEGGERRAVVGARGERSDVNGGAIRQEVIMGGSARRKGKPRHHENHKMSEATKSAIDFRCTACTDTDSPSGSMILTVSASPVSIIDERYLFSLYTQVVSSHHDQSSPATHDSGA